MVDISISTLEKTWQRVLDSAKEELKDPRLFDAFFKDTYIYKVEGDKLIISCANSLSANLLKLKYVDFLKDIVYRETQTNFDLEFDLDSDLKDPDDNTKIVKKPTFFPNNFLEPNYTFDNYVIGPSNSEAAKASLIVAATPGKLYNPLFMYSQSGLGKTHLLNAIGNYCKEKDPLTRVLYCSSQEFIDEYIKYVSGDKNEDNLKEFILSFDILLVDDVQMLQDKTKTEEFFFSIFETLIRQNKQIVLTCDRLPEELNGLDRRLVTRFLKGLTISIQPPSVELCEDILKMKIENIGLKKETIDEDVIHFIASKFKSSIRNLEGALNRLIFYSSINHCEQITMDVAEDALSALIDTKRSKTKVSSSKILNAVSSYYSISVSQLTGKIKTAQIVNARHIAIYLIRQMLDMPLKQIGEIFSNRDHTTIMHSINKVEKMLKTNKDLNIVINNLKKQIK